MTLLSSLLVVSSALAEPSNPSVFGGGGSPHWLSNVERALVEKEYEASENQEGLQAPNRRHGFRAYFDASGARLVDRTAPGSPELARVRLASIGRDEEQQSVAAGTVAGSGGRVEITRSGAVTEHFENSPGGLRQTLTIARRPPGDGDLQVLFEVATAAVERAQEGVVLRAPTGRRLEMRRLPVTDSAGRLLASRLEAAGASLVRFTVADRAAEYPLIVELVFTGGAGGILEADQANAQLGYSVAGAGDVNGDGYGDVIVGAFLYDLGETDEGAAFVYLGTADGVVSGSPLTASATLQSNQASAELGYSVAAAGDVNGDGYGDVIVGARSYDAGEADEGGAFVFLGSASGVPSADASNAAAILQSNQAGAYLGIGVSGAGDVNGDGYGDVIVGAYLYDLGQPDEGAAFVFLGSASGVASGNPSSAATTLQSNQADAYLGIGVAAAGDVNGDGYGDLIVGAPYHDSGDADEGAAFVFLGGPSGVASGSPATASATLQSNQPNAQLGYSVSAAGDVNGDGYGDVIVGAGLYDSGEFDEGAAFVFLGGASGVVSGSPSSAAATLQSDQPSGVFGRSVAAAGDVNGDGYADVIVGAYAYNNGESDEGAAFVFLGSGTGVASGNPSTAAAVLDSNQADALFGTSVAGAGDVNGDGYGDVIVGAFLYDAGAADEGAAFVFLGGGLGVASGNPSSAAATVQANQAIAALGFSVSGAGDVNGDGYGDVIVGAPFYDSGQTDEGAAFVFLGSASGVAVSGSPSNAAATLQSNQAGSWFGYSVSDAGDVNGDGYGDVIVAALSYDSGATDVGAAFVFLGSPSGVDSGSPATAATTLQSNQFDAEFGISVSAAGDVNGDGYGDLIVGAPRYDLGQSNEGAAFLFLGSASGVISGNPSSASATLQANQPEARFGQSVSSAGDVNGDGYGDVIVGAYEYDSGESDEGAAFVFLGTAAGIASGSPSSAAATLQSNQVGARLGVRVSGAGDVNGDGYGDVIAGAYHYDSGEIDEGAAFVFLGGATGVASGNPSTASVITLQCDQAGANFGFNVSGAGDVDGDGYGDVIVGAIFFDSGGEAHEGGAFLFLGSASGLSASAILQSNQQDAQMGYSVSGAGDVNGDGFGDVIVGSRQHDLGQTLEGAAFVFLGGGGPGRQVLARQFRAGSSVPVAPWGSSRDPDSFDVRMFATHPAGGGRVKLEIEACLAGENFGDPSCVHQMSSAWSNVSASSGATLVETVSGLAASRLHHWRARVLHAPASVAASGVTAPPYPPHGPWRRFQAQVNEADLRTQDGVFYTLSPCRVVDTRGGAPIEGPILTDGIERTLLLAGKCLIPLTARAVSLNITAVDPLGAGHLVLYPSAGAPTNTTAISFNSSGNRANNAVCGLNLLGQLQVLPSVSNPSGPDQVHLVVDVNGYFE